MLIILAPLFTVIAVLATGIANAIGYVLHGPHRVRRPPPPLVVLPSVPARYERTEAAEPDPAVT